MLPGGDYAASVLSALTAGSHRKPKGGLSGPIPPGLLALSSLLFLNLAGNAHSGRLPALPPNAVLFNVTGNAVRRARVRRAHLFDAPRRAPSPLVCERAPRTPPTPPPPSPPPQPPPARPAAAVGVPPAAAPKPVVRRLQCQRV